jgi:hypothetical protein
MLVVLLLLCTRGPTLLRGHFKARVNGAGPRTQAAGDQSKLILITLIVLPVQVVVMDSLDVYLNAGWGLAHEVRRLQHSGPRRGVLF